MSPDTFVTYLPGWSLRPPTKHCYESVWTSDCAGFGGDLLRRSWIAREGDSAIKLDSPWRELGRIDGLNAAVADRYGQEGQAFTL